MRPVVWKSDPVLQSRTRFMPPALEGRLLLLSALCHHSKMIDERAILRQRVGSYTSTAFFFEQTDKDLISVFSMRLARSCTNLLSWRIGITETCGLALSASASAHF